MNRVPYCSFMKNWIPIFLLLTLLSCSSTQLHSNQKKRIIKEVQDALNENFADIKKYGFVGEINHLYNSPDFYWIPPRQTTAISYDSIVTILRKSTPFHKEVISTWDSLHILPITKNVASYSGKYNSVYTYTNDKKASFRIMETGVIIKKKGKWLLLNGHTSSLSAAR